MAYITLDYYKTDYVGNDPDDDAALLRNIARASDMVDLMTDQAFSDITTLETYQQKCVKKATAAFTEYFIENGDVFNEESTASESIGSWSRSSGGSGSNMVSKVGIEWLKQSALMNQNIQISGDYHGYDYE